MEVERIDERRFEVLSRSLFLRGSNLTRNFIPRKTSLSLPPFYLRNEFVVRSATLTNVRNRRGVNRKVGKFSFIAPRYFAAWSNGSRSKIRSRVRGGGDGRSTFFDVEAKGNLRGISFNFPCWVDKPMYPANECPDCSTITRVHHARGDVKYRRPYRVSYFCRE